MAVKVDKIAEAIEKFYPLECAESWDNSGFQINLNNATNHAIICLDVSPDVIEEATDVGCGLIISHHPLLFNPLKQINTKNMIGKCVQMLIKNQISLYSAHTSADNALNGLNFTFADLLSLNNIKFISSEHFSKYFKITVFVPPEDAETVKDAMFLAGAGNFNNYSRCCFYTTGNGEFLPGNNANPYLGRPNITEKVEEQRLEALLPEKNLNAVMSAVIAAHPYEEPAIDIYELENPKHPVSGIGVYGELPSPKLYGDVLHILKEKLDLDYLRFTGDISTEVLKIAICVGAAGEYVRLAEYLGADVFITGELKHNIYLESSVKLIELGHFESEKLFRLMMLNCLQKAFFDLKYNLILSISEREKKPYLYF